MGFVEHAKANGACLIAMASVKSETTILARCANIIVHGLIVPEPLEGNLTDHVESVYTVSDRVIMTVRTSPVGYRSERPRPEFESPFRVFVVKSPTTYAITDRDCRRIVIT